MCALLKPRISLIVAMAQNRVIGCDNRLPWHLPADLQRFKTLTWGKPILMGRKTHDSIGRALPGRQNLVLSSDPSYRAAEGCIVVRDIDEGLRQAAAAADLMVIGGSSLYAALLPRASRIYLTTIHRDYPGDVFFPSFEPAEWSLVSREHVADDPRFDSPYTFDVLERIASCVVA
ncbi:dihydrofolate reductase [Methylolobus aquaticus]|uniref:dihydrofolate reductase n=1 Tax=Methylotetracoccus oryzae TaxID=1919059 RepID=UPI00111B8A60|nr:dihydrofolate reductase [Methylotetracoccus oryzae]